MAGTSPKTLTTSSPEPGTSCAAPRLHNTPLTDIEKLRIGGAADTTPQHPSSADCSQEVKSTRSSISLRAAAWASPPLSVEQTDALATHLAVLGHSPSNVIADRDTASAFAESWQRHRSAVPVPPFWRTHLYRLGTLTPPQPRPEGRGRITGGQDREQVVHWCREFCVDVGEQPSIDLIDAGSWDDSRFGDRHFTFWETPDGAPVAMAAATSMVGGMVRVDPVYTPARLRGRGYAGAVTVEASRAALAASATDVVLFTDPDNLTSNALYQRIGSRPRRTSTHRMQAGSRRPYAPSSAPPSLTLAAGGSAGLPKRPKSWWC